MLKERMVKAAGDIYHLQLQKSPIKTTPEVTPTPDKIVKSGSKVLTSKASAYKRVKIR